MNAYVIMGAFLVVLFFAFFFKEVYDYKKRLAKAIEKANKSFGTFNTKDYSLDEFESITSMFYRYEDEDSVDDITASDLDIDEIFAKYDNCLSAPGKEYFYRMLRTPFKSVDEAKAFDKKVSWFLENEEERNKIRAYFLMIGNMRRSNFFKCIDYLKTIKSKKLYKEYTMDILIFVFLGMIFINPTIGIVSFVCFLCFNIVSYYRDRGEIEASVMCLAYITNLLNNAKELCAIKSDAISDDLDELDSLVKSFNGFKRFSGIVTKNGSSSTGVGNPLDIFGDYLKMIFHLDIIRFYKMLDYLKARMDSVEKIYCLLGKIEAYINVASIRKSLPVYCKPELADGIKAVNVYHPLVDNPVTNSIEAHKGVLITGSNASGKSTFLKTIAINALFSRTIYTCLADSFACDNYYVFSSMSLRDDILNKNSYFMVEIKAVKRILDYISKYPDKKVLCFVDELLRGTNTVERIAACSQILKELENGNTLCFAATHDIELTDILDGIYSNYHFDEEIIDDDIIFNYRLKEGKATSKNAIKLLSIMGFSDEIVDSAKLMADRFVSDTIWQKA